MTNSCGKSEKKYVVNRILSFVHKHNHIPQLFKPYNQLEIFDISPTITCSTGIFTGIGGVIIFEFNQKFEKN